MKKILLLLPLFMLSLLAACNNSGPLVAVVDENRILLQSRQGREATRQGEALHNTMQQNLAAVEQALAAYPNKEQARAILLTEINKIQISLREGQEDIFRRVDTALAKIIEEYRAQKGITFMISANKALGFSPAIDASDDLIPLFDALPLDFAALPPLNLQPQLPPPLPAPPAEPAALP